MKSWINRFVLLTAVIIVPLSASAAESVPIEPARVGEALDRLAHDAEGSVESTVHPATGVPRLVRIPAGALHLEDASPKAKAMTFFERHGLVLGIKDPARELVEIEHGVDFLGMTHLSYQQVFEGIPVFAAVLRAHFDPGGAIVTVNGTFIPNLDLDPTPTLGDQEAAIIARRVVSKEHGADPFELETAPATLYVYRAGLARGAPGTDYLVWELEVSDRREVREFVYVDSHSGAVVDRIQGIHQLTRKISQYELDNVIWSEGDSLPFRGLETPIRDDEVNFLIRFTAETFDLFANLSGGEYLSFDGNDAPMHAIYERREFFCPSPNAAWDGEATNFCYRMVGDDVVGHEWTHAYSEFTHDLIYAWQPGALNESYSDIFGELIDLLNNDGMDEPGGARTDGKCSTFGGEVISLRITAHSPASLAGPFEARGAGFNPEPPWSARGEVKLGNDGIGDPNDACEPLVDFSPGRIALINDGGCIHLQKIEAAVDAGAAGLIMVTGNDRGVGSVAGWTDDALIGASISKRDGDAFKAALANGIEVTIEEDIPSDVSVRWLMGEDTLPHGAIRDLWNPSCFWDPGMIGGATGFNCGGNRDFGGVHSSSGVPNHAFALLVDGGTHLRNTVAAIGATRAAHIYWRAMSVYQVPTTDFADHADLLELSCADLVGAALTDLVTGQSSPEVIRPEDCNQVVEAMLAVNMRGSDDYCSDLFTVLEPDAPRVWTSQVVFSESFDRDPGSTWHTSNEGVYTEYDPRNWLWTDQVPEEGDGGAFFAIDSPTIGDCEPGSDDQTGVMHLESPPIVLPETARPMVLVFDHYVATETVRDGGNLKISVNGGAFQPIEMDAFQFNPYNTSIDPEWGGPTNMNPLAGESVFSGLDEGKVVGSWGQSQIALDDIAQPGDSIQLRFDFGTDGCTGVDGWYVDNVKIVITVMPVRSSGRRFRP